MENSRSPLAFSWASKALNSGTCSGSAFVRRLRQIAAQRLAALADVLDLGAVVGRAVVGRLGNLVVGHRDLEAVAECLDRLLAHLLLLVRDVLPFPGLAHAVALDGLGEDDGGLTLVLHCRGVRRINLLRVVTAAVEPPDVIIAHVGDHVLQLLILAEEVLAGEGAAAGLEHLVFAVDALFHALAQQARGVARQQRVPVGAPQHLDDVPAGAPEVPLQLLDDAAVAADGSVQPLQIAVDDEDQVVQLLPRTHRDGAQRLRLVHLAVAHEAPHLARIGVDHVAVVQVLHEAGLVDGHDRPEPHGDRGKLPEIRHQPGVRIGREAAAVDLLPEFVELLFRQASFDEGAGVDAGRRVPLDEHQVAAVTLAGRVPEMIEPDIVEGGAGGEARDVAAELAGDLVGANDHRHGVPADDGAQPPFEARDAGITFFLRGKDGIHVRRIRVERQRNAEFARLRRQPVEQKMQSLRSFVVEDRLQGLQPFPCFDRIDVAVSGKIEHPGFSSSNPALGFRADITALDSRLGRESRP